MAKGFFRGHPIVWQEDNEKWVYEDSNLPIPGGGGEARPCKKCGQIGWSGEGDHDRCLSLLPGVDNACCGHGVPEKAYIRFTNGVVVKGFTIEYTEKFVRSE